jgi:uncharacterized protein YwgA
MLLLALAAADDSGLSPIQIQKTMFLLDRSVAEYIQEPRYSFRPYNYGPFDAQVYDDSERLAADGLAEIRRHTQSRYATVMVSQEGKRRAEAIAQKEDPEFIEYIHELVQWVLKQTFRSLVQAIYEQHPEMRANSVFRD